MKKIILSIIIVLSFIGISVNAQNENIEIGGLGEQISEFTLKSMQGDEVSISDYKGENVILMFPRGKVLENLWCPICAYQYAELVYFDEMDDIRKKYNLEILFVLPYSEEEVKDWKDKLINGIRTVEGWKYPENYEELEGDSKRWADQSRKFFPITVDTLNLTYPFLVLIDSDQKVSKGFNLFREEWDGTQVEQNVPTFFILDKDNVIRFKYHSQSTVDRPSAEYLINIIEKLL